jgi:hypothetical protein
MGVSRGQIQDAIMGWRDGQTFDALHPLLDWPDARIAIFWDDNAMKDLARVIMATIDGRDIPSVEMPW